MNRARSRHRPLSLEGLRSFEVVSRCLNISAAAEELHLTPSSISRQIKRLEEELGAVLFHRAARGVELTQAGQALWRVVQPALGRVDACVKQIRRVHDRAFVSVATFPSFASLWLMPRLPDFERRHPGVDIRIAATDRMVEPDDVELDVALRHCLPERAPAGALRLFGEVLTPVIGTRLAEAMVRGEAPPLHGPQDLAAHTLLDMDDGYSVTAQLSWPMWWAARGLEPLVPRRWISVNYTHQQVQAALVGQGVALARLAMVDEAVARGDLIEPFGTAGRSWVAPCYWLVPLGSETASRRPEVQAFIDWILAQSQQTRAQIGDVPDPESTAHAD